MMRKSLRNWMRRSRGGRTRGAAIRSNLEQDEEQNEEQDEDKEQYELEEEHEEQLGAGRAG